MDKPNTSSSFNLDASLSDDDDINFNVQCHNESHFEPLTSGEQKILSTQQVFDMMRGEVEKVCGVTGVSKQPELVFKELLNVVFFSLPAFGKQSTIASHTLQMGQ